MRIREWDDMEAEFGMNRDSIRARGTFAASMRCLCGQVLTISMVNSSTYKVKEVGYVISDDMIEYKLIRRVPDDALYKRR